MPKIISLFFCCVLPFLLAAQNDTVSITNNTDTLLSLYGKHKHILKEYELPSLLALSYYPELSNEIIVFKYKSINSSARTTMTPGSIFRKTGKKYIIYINDDSAKTGMTIMDAPFDAQVAVIGHELAHAADFKNKGFFDLVLWGLGYLFVKESTKIERRTDKVTIRHGLGGALYHWADYVLNHSTADEHYKKMKAKKYMHPYEILLYMASHKKATTFNFINNILNSIGKNISLLH